MNNIVLIGGRRGAGKDSLARILKTFLPNSYTLSLSAPLKGALFFGHHNMYSFFPQLDDNTREKLIELGNYCQSFNQNVYSYQVLGSVRYILQHNKEIGDKPCTIFVTGWRFLHEFECIANPINSSGHLDIPVSSVFAVYLKRNRSGNKVDKIDNSRSETELEKHLDSLPCFVYRVTVPEDNSLFYESLFCIASHFLGYLSKSGVSVPSTRRISVLLISSYPKVRKLIDVLINRGLLNLSVGLGVGLGSFCHEDFDGIRNTLSRQDIDVVVIDVENALHAFYAFVYSMALRMMGIPVVLCVSSKLLQYKSEYLAPLKKMGIPVFTGLHDAMRYIRDIFWLYDGSLSVEPLYSLDKEGSVIAIHSGR